jgi:arylsulfatase A-like enzyme
MPILFRVAFAAAAFTCVHGVAGAEDLRRPNIVVILADDLGYGDLGCYGQQLFATPRIDRMAAEGLRFSQFYAGSPVCAPSRCTLLTGLHTGHARIRGNGTPDGRPVALLPKDLTLAEVLRSAGYSTACIGKWGLGEHGSTGIPNAQGFDYFYGFLNQVDAHFHYPRTLWRDDAEFILEGNDPDAHTGTPAQTLFTTETLAYIRAHAAAPFFLYLTYTVPHAELAAPADEIASFAGECFEPETPFAKDHYGAQPKPRAAFAAMVTMLDRDVGRVLDLLDDLGLSKNTLVLFTSDNGPHREGGHDPEYFDSNGPLRGIKRDVYDGGIRVPLIARWPGAIAPGSITPHVAAFWDLLPTCAEFAGAKIPKHLDGISFAPTLRGDSAQQKQHDYLYWEFYEQGGRQALRARDWKAVRMNVLRDPAAPVELYNLTDDVGETHDLAASNPETAARLRALMRSTHTPSRDFSLPQP